MHALMIVYVCYVHSLCSCLQTLIVEYMRTFLSTVQITWSSTLKSDSTLVLVTSGNNGLVVVQWFIKLECLEDLETLNGKKTSWWVVVEVH